ncbi:MAG: FtsX-like permease family protein [Candidatus Aminicenantes bacterium]|nr:MAG: FtsX-like permease family protein [Candidatus Aminicenantes bacterium]
MARVNFSESVSMAMGSLWSNKLRTFLTLLGIIIGVLTIIAVVSIIQGLNNYVYTQFAFFGANDFTVSKFSMTGGSIKEYREMMKRKNLTLDEMRLLRRKCQSCELIGASVSTTRTVKFSNQYLKDVEIRGVTHLDHMIGSVVELDRGRHILKEDDDHSRYVCIIGADIVEKLFPYLDPLGKRIKVGPHNFLVTGIGEQKGKLLGMSQDNYVRIPITTFHKIYGSRRSININVHTKSQEQMEIAQEEVRTILRSKRHLSFKDKDDFSFVSSETFIQMYRAATSSIYFAMIAISSIALLVGGIVVMNIMLVAVTERTKEIGIRMSVGARRLDILFQFLIESAAISTTGGLIGILIGFILAKIVTAATSLPSTLDPGSIVVAIIVSGSVGIFFGIYPANKAAKLNPIEALRSEQ